jgi:hypothetical protein
MDEDSELNKKILQGFDEKKDYGDMCCKRLHTELLADEDIIENVIDMQAYQEMFPVHKVSKFG